MKIIINKCYGGFGLSEAAYERLIELGIPVQAYIEQKRGTDGLYHPEPKNDGKVIFDRSIGESKFDKTMLSFARYWDAWSDIDKRTDPLVIQVVEELGVKANGPHAELCIVEIPDDIEWEIYEYDGMEHIAEKHRTWW